MKKHPSLLTRLAAGATAAVAFAGLARADFNPVPLTPASFTFGIVVPANTYQALPYCISGTVGTGDTEGDNTIYEQGFRTILGAGTKFRCPPHNTTFVARNNPNITFLMPPDLTTNNDLMIYGTGNFATGTLTFNTPTTATNLAILCTDGNGSQTVSYTVNHADGSTDTGTLAMADWFNGGATVAWGCNGRITAGGGYNNYSASAVNSSAPYLYDMNIPVSGSSPILSVTFSNPGGSFANYFAISGNASGANWTPIPVSGFNIMTIVPVAFPVTATMDQGTNVVQNGGNGNNTWYEQGFYRGDVTSGIPPSGSTFASLSQPTHFYQMGNYSANNAILIDTNHQSANIVPATPASYSAFAFLTAGANEGSSAMTNICILQHANGTSETNVFLGFDWFNSANPAAVAWVANGRVAMDDRTLQNTNNSGNPKLFETYFTLKDVVTPVTNIVVQFGTAPGVNSTTFILAVSATAGALPPLLGEQPVSQTWFPGQTATFTASVIAGTAPITNSWLADYGTGIFTPLKDGVDANGSTISGSTTTTLTISGLTLADTGNYEFEASNAGGEVTSTNAFLTVSGGTPVAPIIDSQLPAGPVSAFAGRSTVFSVTLDPSSSPPFTYQWFAGGTAIPGATNATYTNIASANVTIDVVVANFVGSATSTPIPITIITPTAYQSALLAYNPVGYWPLTETSGTIAVDYASGNDGTYVGTVTLGQPGLPATAGIGANTSVAFDGATAYVDVPEGNLNIVGPMTLIQWVQTTFETQFTTSAGHGDNSYRLDVEQAGFPHFADESPDVVGPVAVTDGNWHQLVGVYDGKNELLYVDGLIAASAAAGAPAGNGNDFWIGGAPDYVGSRLFAGNICQVAILTNALTAAQVASLYYSLDIPPTVSIAPAAPSVYDGANITLTASVTGGTPPVSFQWYTIVSGQSNNVAGATTATFTITAATLAQNGSTIGVIASNPYGTNTATVTLTVQSGPPIIQVDLPATDAVYPGDALTLSAQVAGTAPITFGWTFNGHKLTDGGQVSGTSTATLVVSDVSQANAGAYQLFATNALGNAASAVCAVTILQSVVGFNGFAGWTLQATATQQGDNVLQLTDGNGGEVASAFFDSTVYIGDFEASWTYWDTNSGGADGVCFVIQNDPRGAKAIGAGGGQLGFGSPGPITNSVSFEYNIYSGNGYGGVGIAFGVEGVPGNTFQPGALNIIGDPILTKGVYKNGTLTVTLTDTNAGTSFTTSVAVNIPALVGGNTAYVGFTGGDGGVSSVQQVSDFVFTPLVSLTVGVSGGNFVLSWPIGVGAYALQQTPSLTTAFVNSSAVVTQSGGMNVATVPISSGARFFQLVLAPGQ